MGHRSRNDPRCARNDPVPLLDALDQGPLPVPAEVFAVIAIVAVTNTALLALTTASRQLYGLAEQGSVPPFLARVGSRRTPSAAILAVALVTTGLAVTGGVRELADTTVVLLLAVFTMVNITTVVLRSNRRDRTGVTADRTDPDGPVISAEPTFGVPLVLPVIGTLACSGLLLHTLLNSGPALFVRLGVLLGLGLVLFLLNRRHVT